MNQIELLRTILDSTTCLDLSKGEITKRQMEVLSKVLKQNKTITMLNLGNTKLSDDTIKVVLELLEVNTCLKQLDLSA